MEKTEELRYNMYGSRCLTLCPYKPDMGINSNGCRNCKYYAGNIGFNSIGCDHRVQVDDTNAVHIILEVKIKLIN